MALDNLEGRDRAVCRASAYSQEEQITEITAISALLEKIALEGCVVTIDPMGCQYKIDSQIVTGKGITYFHCKRTSRL